MPYFKKHSSRSNNYKPFLSLPKSARKKAVQKVKNNIRLHANRHSPLFFSNCEIHEDGRPELMNSFAQVQFISADRKFFWNCIVKTATRSFWDISSKMADDKSYEICPLSKEDSLFFNGRFDLQAFLSRPDEHHDSLGGMTRTEYQRKACSEIISTSPPLIYESVAKQTDWEWGVGLEVTLDVTGLTPAIIDDFIMQFRKNGEREYCSAEPVGRANLPIESLEDYMLRNSISIHCWSNKVLKTKRHRIWKR